jgi:putative transposase
MRYIEMNPVRAGMVEAPDSYRWSSFEVNAMGRSNHIITRHPIYQALGHTDVERQAAYRSLFNACIDTDDLRRIRESTERGEIIGNERFRAQIAEMLGRRVEKFAHGGDRKSETYLNQ